MTVLSWFLRLFPTTHSSSEMCALHATISYGNNHKCIGWKTWNAYLSCAYRILDMQNNPRLLLLISSSMPKVPHDPLTTKHMVNSTLFCEASSTLIHNVYNCCNFSITSFMSTSNVWELKQSLPDIIERRIMKYLWATRFGDKFWINATTTTLNEQLTSFHAIGACL